MTDRKKKYILELTEEQVKVLSTACEFFARIKMGQFGEIVFHCANKHCPEDPEAAQDAWLEFRKHIFPELHGAGHSYGIGYSKEADTAFDIYQVIRQQFGDPRGVFSFNELPKLSVREEP